MSDNSDSSRAQPLDYGRREVRIFKALRFVAIVSAIALTLAGFAAVIPGLHNDPPFLPLWFVTLLITTPLIWTYWYRSRDGRQWRASVVAVLTLWAFGATLGAWVSYATLTGVDPHVIARNRHYCNMHLMTIRNVLAEYADENGGRFPRSLSQLVAASPTGVDITIFTCPGAQGSYLATPTTQAVTVQLSGAKPDYVYRGSALTTSCPPKAILLHDQLGNHSHDTGPDEVNFLYADGSMEWLKPRAAARIIAELDAGHNPPRREMIE